MSDQVATALVDLFRAECAQRLVLLVLEDLHWSDGLTIKLIESLVREVGNCPFLVLAFARPEVYETFPSLFAVRASVLTLRGLGAKASERLIRQVLGETVDAGTVARIVRQAAGNALFLEELIRAVAEGHGEAMPETVLAILQSRMSRLDPGTRRLLRAGAIFGAEFWQSGAVELCGGTKGEAEIDECLRVAIEQEFIERSKESRFPSEIQYAFRHALMRDAAYSLLTEQDRRTGHRLAAPFLEKLSEPDPAVLADHFQKGGEPARAVPYFIRAAELAAAGNDLPGTTGRV
jgi:predicted ATPase